MTLELLCKVVESSLIVSVGAVIGLGLVTLGELAARRLWPKPPAKPEASYTIQLTDSDGWPIRQYALTAKEVGKLVGDLDREHRR